MRRAGQMRGKDEEVSQGTGHVVWTTQTLNASPAWTYQIIKLEPMHSDETRETHLILSASSPGARSEQARLQLQTERRPVARGVEEGKSCKLF